MIAPKEKTEQTTITITTKIHTDQTQGENIKRSQCVTENKH